MDYKQCFEMLSDSFESKGAFLTVKNDDKINTMTIGWGEMGYIWGKSVISVLVRYSRYTFDMINNAKYFTVSVPKKGELEKELSFCGTKSAREYDKFKQCNLTKQQAKCFDGVVIGECSLHFEAEIIYKQIMDPNLILNDCVKKHYKGNNDYHMIFTGMILDCYKK